MKTNIVWPVRVLAVRAIILQSILSLPALAAISNMPPLVRTNVAPNIFFTLDDSGSMMWEAMPDSLVYATTGFPQPSGVYKSGLRQNDVMGFGDGVGTSNVNNIYVAKYRSSSVNSLYYNPAILYEPWVSSAGVPMAPANPVAAMFNPVVVNGSAATATMNLTTNVQSVLWPNISWNKSDNSGNITESRNFYPATYFKYDPVGTTCAPANTNTLACFTRVEIKAATATYTKMSAARTDCDPAPPAAPSPTCTYAQEIQNFANWFQYWRSRTLLANGGTGKAFAKQATNIRVGFGAINKTGAFLGAPGTVVNGVTNDFSGTNRTNFFDTLYKWPNANSGTPLRQALDQVGQYFLNKTTTGPWQNVVGSTGTAATDQFTCRQNYHILMTDGYWNRATAPASGSRALNVDGTNGTLMTSADGSKYQYKTTGSTFIPAPLNGVIQPTQTNTDKQYADAFANTLADVAMYYWVNDLRPDWGVAMKNVPIASSNADPAFWQHLVQYTVGLGVNGGLIFPTDLPALTAGTKVWPDPELAGTEIHKVDDLWHAAVNGHGQYFSAANPKQFGDALSVALNDIAARSGDAAAVGTSSNTVRSGSKIYISTYNTKDWSGMLEQKNLDAAGIITGRDWIINNLWIWPSPLSRNIISYKDATTKGVTFDFANLAVTDQAYFTGAATTTFSGAVTGSDIVDYLKGVKAKELLSGGVFRNRDSLLGDLVGSSPQYGGQGENEFYAYLPSGTPGKSSYFNYFNVIKKARAPRVFVGSNDGMLHAFQVSGGQEDFAYVPKTVMANLPSLADPAYTHKFYVNGTPTIADAYLSGWKTVLLGTTGAGGRGIFALDISNSVFSPADVLWEINSSNDAELGYTIGSPQVGRAPNGDWVAVFGNGYESASKRAMLFVVNLANGAITKIDTGVGSGALPNGMATPRLMIDKNSTIKAVYAGDLQGNLWKFDFTPGGATLAFSNSRLYQAKDSLGNVQPITVQPDTYPHPLGGLIVTFGTGKLFETGDSAVSNLQSIYGVWDKSGIPNVTATTISGLSDLVQQTLSSVGTDLTLLSNNSIDWTTKRGWYINLNMNAGERVIVDPEVVYDAIAYLTVIPGSTTDPCISDGRSTTMFINALTGGAVPDKVLDTDGNNVIDASDTRASGQTSALSFGNTILRKKGGIKIYQADTSGNIKGGAPGMTSKFDGIPTVRLWRQILNKE